MTLRFSKVLCPCLVYGVILLCALVFACFQQAGDSAIVALYLPPGGVNLIDTHAYWQFITPSFIHFTLVHLLGNLIVWWYLARIIGSVAPGWLWLLFVTSAIVSNLAQWLWQAGYFGGLSGVVAALVGFMAGYQWLRPGGLFYIQWSLVLGFIVTIAVVSGGYFGVYSNAAHFAGLIWGGLSGVVFVKHESVLTQPN